MFAVLKQQLKKIITIKKYVRPTCISNQHFFYADTFIILVIQYKCIQHFW